MFECWSLLEEERMVIVRGRRREKAKENERRGLMLDLDRTMMLPCAIFYKSHAEGEDAGCRARVRDAVVLVCSAVGWSSWTGARTGRGTVVCIFLFFFARTYGYARVDDVEGWLGWWWLAAWWCAVRCVRKR